MSNMREFMKLMEAEYEGGPVIHPDVRYSHEEKKGQINKVIATLSSYKSAEYTKLGRKFNRIKELSDEIDKLKEEVKADTKVYIADMFNAEDECRTRVIETVGFTFELTKVPEPSKTVQYSKVLDALAEHLTPELIAVMESLKNQFSNTVQKSPGLKATDKSVKKESLELNEGFWDNLRAYARKFLTKITAWGKSYDRKLDALRAEVGLSESLNEVSPSVSTNELIEQLIIATLDLGKAQGALYSEDLIDDYRAKFKAARDALYATLK